MIISSARADGRLAPDIDNPYPQIVAAGASTGLAAKRTDVQPLQHAEERR